MRFIVLAILSLCLLAAITDLEQSQRTIEKAISSIQITYIKECSKEAMNKTVKKSQEIFSQIVEKLKKSTD